MANVIPLDTSSVRSRGERLAAGKALRAKVPREAHAEWAGDGAQRDPVAVIERSNAGRIPDLIPIRYGRMMRSPFTFLRGAAALMADDLATGPRTGLTVQACGDAHLLNFGLFATPERNLVFSLNDFDETHPGPWEWDLKRLATSVVVAARECGHRSDQVRQSALACARTYRERLRAFSKMSPLEVWYTRLDMDRLIREAPDGESRRLHKRTAEKARQHVVEHLFPRIVKRVGGRHLFADQPPLVFHGDDDEVARGAATALEQFRDSLPHERRILFDRFTLHDFATKVVGIGSVGTVCGIALFLSQDGHPLVLQVKEARHSVLEPHTAPCRFKSQGQRVVVGQRLMQAASDIFLGWFRAHDGRDYFVRQLRDMKASMPVEGMSAEQLRRYGEICAWTLARAHAKTGDASTISGYLGKGAAFDEALMAFALAYADQTERDHARLLDALREGRVKAVDEAA